MAAAQSPVRDTLVAYIFADTEPQYLANMEFFIRTAIREDDKCDYVIVLQVSCSTSAAGALAGHHRPGCHERGRQRSAAKQFQADERRPHMALPAHVPASS
jgi:hypothetical protein